MDATKPITISAETYERLVAAVENNIKLNQEIAQRDKEIQKLSAAPKYLSKFLDEFEGAWDSDEQCASPEIAQDYIDAAKYMLDNFGRINNRIRYVEEWLNNYLPY